MLSAVSAVLFLLVVGVFQHNNSSGNNNNNNNTIRNANKRGTSHSSSSDRSEHGRVYYSVQDLPATDFDVILVLGGGVPKSLEEPPLFVQKRCDDAAAVIQRHGSLIPILSLSAGSTHVPQLLSEKGLPVWEATASSAYLQKHYGYTTNLFVETTSFDTIGNAYFARTAHTDIAGWRRLLVVTNKFHMDRTKAIFDWIFAVPPAGADWSMNSGIEPYQLMYLASPDVGLSNQALKARRQHEAKGAKTVREKLAPQHTTLKQVWEFVTTKHDLYTATKLIDGATEVSDNDGSLKDSYGGGGGRS